ncbi:hypothetical protein FORC72_1690 [Vibrio parahaemolyticus]|nr:hypothetical protein FORC72_1690 [Vibrio parahaemolyticus]
MLDWSTKILGMAYLERIKNYQMKCVNMLKATTNSMSEIKYNKAFKSDSQRLAFFIQPLGFVFTVVWLSFVMALLTP